MAGGLGWRASSGQVPRKGTEIPGVTNTSLLGLEAELHRTKAGRESESGNHISSSRVRRKQLITGPGKQINAGVQKRSEADLESARIAQHSTDIESIHESLTRKAAEYERLAAAECSADEEDAYDVDFVRKGIDQHAAAELQRRRQQEHCSDDEEEQALLQSRKRRRSQRGENEDDEDNVAPHKRKPPKWHPAYEGDSSSASSSDADASDDGIDEGKKAQQATQSHDTIEVERNEAEEQQQREERIRERHAIAGEANEARDRLLLQRQQRMDDKRKRRERLKREFILYKLREEEAQQNSTSA